MHYFCRIRKLCHDVDRVDGTSTEYNSTQNNSRIQDNISTLECCKHSVGDCILEQFGFQINLSWLRKKVSRFVRQFFLAECCFLLVCRIDTPNDFIEANLTWGGKTNLKFYTYFDTSVSSVITIILSYG